jgi:endonuclease III
MSNVKKLKTHDRQTIVQNLMTAMKKRYKSAVPKHSHNLLETLLYAAILEDATESEASEAFDRLLKGFHDLNEIRVSTISEIEEALSPLHNAGWSALRIREILQHTFEKFYKFDLEELKRKPVEQVEKHLSKFKHTTPFMKLFLLQNSLGAHTVPLDDKGRDLLAFLGVIEPQATIEAAAEDLKAVVRKADSHLFCHLVRCMACDPQFKGKLRLTSNQALGEGPDANTAVQRLTEVFGGHTPKTPPGPSPKAKADMEKEEQAKAAAKKSSRPEPVVVKPASPAKAAPAKAAPATAKAVPAKPAAKAHVATVKKPVDKKTTAVRVEAVKSKEVVTKKVSKPQAPADKKTARKK